MTRDNVFELSAVRGPTGGDQPPPVNATPAAAAPPPLPQGAAAVPPDWQHTELARAVEMLRPGAELFNLLTEARRLVYSPAEDAADELWDALQSGERARLIPVLRRFESIGHLAGSLSRRLEGRP